MYQLLLGQMQQQQQKTMENAGVHEVGKLLTLCSLLVL